MAARAYTAETLLFRPGIFPGDRQLVLNITPDVAGWDLISFQVRRLEATEQWHFSTANEELAFVTLFGDLQCQF